MQRGYARRAADGFLLGALLDGHVRARVVPQIDLPGPGNFLFRIEQLQRTSDHEAIVTLVRDPRAATGAGGGGS